MGKPDHHNLKELIGRTFSMTVDRPLGSCHPRYPEMIYPINYGYLPDTMAGDGMQQDVYLLGVNRPVETFSGVIIAILQRADDVEDKLVMAPAGVHFSDEEILKQVHFQERYFKTTLHR